MHLRNVGVVIADTCTNSAFPANVAGTVTPLFQPQTTEDLLWMDLCSDQKICL